MSWVSATEQGNGQMASTLFDLTGEVAVVIGGTGALGGAMAQALAEAGAAVAIVGRSAERGQERVQQMTAAGARGMFQAADAMDAASLTAAREAIAAKLGPITCLVNAAGGNKPAATLPPGSDFCALPREAWNEVFDLNLVGGVLLPSQVFGQAMVANGRGNIINIASMSGMIPLSRVVAYSAAKAAVINLTMFLAREWATKGVRVNAISPGFFPAEQNRKLLFNDDGSYSARGQQIFGTAEELGGATVWLAAPKAAGFVTGQNIVVDGGFSAVTI
jgi:NAD(P)-dependent dehydrogenase (short-subunit alcohol dehydrogenase family)